MTPSLRVCQLVKVSLRGKVLRICCRSSPTTPASGSTDPHVRGIAPFPEPGDFTASPAPCQGLPGGPKSRFQRRASLTSRSACRREKRTLTCLSGTQRLSHIDITMSSAWASAFSRWVAAARGGHFSNPRSLAPCFVLCRVRSSEQRCLPALIAQDCDLREQPNQIITAAGYCQPLSRCRERSCVRSSVSSSPPLANLTRKPVRATDKSYHPRHTMSSSASG